MPEKTSEQHGAEPPSRRPIVDGSEASRGRRMTWRPSDIVVDPPMKSDDGADSDGD